MQKIVILLIAMVLTIPTYAQNKKKENKEEWKGRVLAHMRAHREMKKAETVTAGESVADKK